MAEHLMERGIPIVLFTGGFAPKSIRMRHANVPVLEKPASDDEIVSAILAAVNVTKRAGTPEAA